jgi:hypothetical protein
MNKRALTPIAATFVLLLFSIALGILIMSFGESFIEEHENPEVAHYDELHALKEQFLNEEITAEEYGARKAEIIGSAES